MDLVDVRTADGVSLRAEVREPKGAARATAILAHAAFARRSAFTKDGGLAAFLGERGVRTVAFDFRGHGESGKPARTGYSWSYDDLARTDLPTVAACVRERFDDGPVVVVGHSLGAHAALAGAGTGALLVDAIVSFGLSLWHPAFEPSVTRRAQQAAALAALGRLTRAFGYTPARALRLGSDDECSRFFDSQLRLVREGQWRSEDFRHDYASALHRVRVPVLAISSVRDVVAAPASVDRVLAALGGPRDHFVLRHGDDGGRAPGHRRLVTGEGAKAGWLMAWEFIQRLALPRGSGTTRS